MEHPQNAGVQQTVQPPQLAVILQSIDELVNDIILQYTNNGGENSVRSRQSALKSFKEMMITVQRKTSKATHEVEAKLGPSSQLGHGLVTDAPLEDLIGVSPESELNRVLRRMPLGDKLSYKLRTLPTSPASPQLITEEDTAASLSLNPEEPVVVLQPTLRNVWVVQHAYMKLVNYKENLIKQYLAAVDPGVALSRKFVREYYEDLSLANLPSKNKLGNLLDIKRSSYNNANHDMMIVLVFTNSDFSYRYIEAVTGNSVDVDTQDENTPYLVLPASEASIKKLYDVYRSLRKATSEQRRATKDKLFAANLPTDAMDELQKQFNFGSSGEPTETNGSGSKKRRRMLEDNE
ncbi:hypothetical protein M434DRAFT_235861 [Hypoxylon sp. CO27-5]|nr:hypothetical protein M434DRAFT_235861 [Hypoxylon sp. CO27-5]